MLLRDPCGEFRFSKRHRDQVVGQGDDSDDDGAAGGGRGGVGGGRGGGVDVGGPGVKDGEGARVIGSYAVSDDLSMSDSDEEEEEEEEDDG